MPMRATRHSALGGPGVPRGGRVHVWDGVSFSYPSLGWTSHDWLAYHTANGELFPAAGNLR